MGGDEHLAEDVVVEGIFVKTHFLLQSRLTSLYFSPKNSRTLVVICFFLKNILN